MTNNLEDKIEEERVMTNNLEDEIEEERDIIFLIPEIVALLGGIVSAVLIALPISYLLNIIPSLGSIIIAPLVEEPSKIIGIILLALYYPNSIDNKKRGLLLGVMAGIGFAFIENLVYAISYPKSIELRAIMPVLMHICTSATAALGVALLSKKVDTSLTGILPFMQLNCKEVKSFLIIAMFFHFMYNLLSYLILDNGLWIILWVANIVLDYIILNKLYSYLPEKLTGTKITGVVELLSKAIRFKRREEHQTRLIDFE